MPDYYAQHDDTVQAFHTWRSSPEAQSPGIRGPSLDLECQYIPKSKVEGYFDRPGAVDHLLDTVLDSRHRSSVTRDYVRDHYLRTFAILLCIGQGGSIYYFQQHSSLRDDKLPFRNRPSDFPVLQPDIFEDFKNAQWQFCASKLEYDMSDRFKEEDILPITRKEKIGEGGSAIVYKIVIDEEYNSLRPRSNIRPNYHEQHRNTFVLKTYRTPEAEKDYRAEREAFMMLRWSGNPTSNVVAYYGGFVYCNSYNTILEYADSGTLEEFMRTTDPPTLVEDTLLFWDRLSGITQGVMVIHGRISNEESRSASQYLKGYLNGRHQDIKPANILVFSGNGPSSYDRHFKIADLGLSQFQPSGPQLHEVSGLDAFGTRAYGAPETYRSHEGTESSHLQVTPAVDIWSIGCIFSEASVWAHYGWRRVAEYRSRRSSEIENKGGAVGDHCFHHEANILDVVQSMHEDLLRNRTASQYTTRLVLDRLVIDMLQHGARPPAKLVYEKAKRLIKDCENKFGVSVNELEGNSNSTFQIRNAGNGTWRPLSVQTEQTGPRESLPSRQHLSLVERGFPQPLPPDDDSPLESQTSPPIFHHHSSSQNSQTRNIGPAQAIQPNRFQPSPSPPAAFQSQESVETQLPQRPKAKPEPAEVKPEPPALSVDDGINWKDQCKAKERSILPGRENLPTLHKRDHIFLIDTSATMKQHKLNIQRLTLLLAYILKNTDENGLDIYFTQSAREVNSRKSSDIANSILHEAFEGKSDMRASLKRVLQQHIERFGTMVPQKSKYLRRQLPPQPQRPLSVYVLTDALWQPTDVGGFVKDIVQSMIIKGCPKEHVGISFIRFGDVPASINKLNTLDHGLGLGEKGMDIVDHTYWNGNVWKMLLGPINDWYDDDPPEAAASGHISHVIP